MVDDEQTELEFWSDGEVFKFELDSSEFEASLEQTGEPIIIKRVVKSAGCKCTKCGEFYEFSEPNQEDGTFKCWGCRH
jgi:hypothetical protein